MPYEIQVHESASNEIESLRVFDQRLIMDAIEKHLSHQAVVPTRRRKRLDALIPQFEHVPPIWNFASAASESCMMLTKLPESFIFVLFAAKDPVKQPRILHEIRIC